MRHDERYDVFISVDVPTSADWPTPPRSPSVPTVAWSSTIIPRARSSAM
ncbi:MAG: hypothetical protein ACLTSX_14755 [Collinsella sp.]